MEFSKSLAPHTGKVFEKISKLECIKPFTLAGGTALSLQIKKRQSEDLESVGHVANYEIASLDYVTFDFEGVRLSFYAAPRKVIPSMQRIPYLNNLYLADIESIGAMKMEAMLRRSQFRDYYDIYSILKEGKDIQKMIDAALEHSNHKLRTRGLLAMLTNGRRFIKEKGFEELQPVYNVSATDIQEYIKQKLLEVKK